MSELGMHLTLMLCVERGNRINELETALRGIAQIRIEEMDGLSKLVMLARIQDMVREALPKPSRGAEKMVQRQVVRSPTKGEIA